MNAATLPSVPSFESWVNPGEPFFSITREFEVIAVRRSLRFFCKPLVKVVLGISGKDRAQWAQDIGCLIYQVGETTPYPPGRITVWLPLSSFSGAQKMIGTNRRARVVPGRFRWRCVRHDLAAI